MLGSTCLKDRLIGMTTEFGKSASKGGILIMNKPGSGKTLAVLMQIIRVKSSMMFGNMNKLKVEWITYTPDIVPEQTARKPQACFHPLKCYLDKLLLEFTIPTPSIRMNFSGYRKLAKKILTIINDAELSRMLAKDYMIDPLILINNAVASG